MRVPTDRDIDVVKRIATIYAKAQPEQHDNVEFVAETAIIMLHGMSVGLTPTDSLMAYDMPLFGGPAGRRTLNTKPDETLRLVSLHPNYDWRSGARQDQEVCEFQFRRRSPGGEWEGWVDYRMTRGDADKLGLTSDDDHKSGTFRDKKTGRERPVFCGCDACQFKRYPVQMLRAKAVKFGVMKHCPDIHGVEADMVTMTELPDGSFEASQAADPPPSFVNPAGFSPVPDEDEPERDWISGEELSQDEADAVDADEAADDVDVDAKSEVESRYSYLMSRLDDAGFVLARSADGGANADQLGKAIRVISDYQGVPVPSSQWFAQVRELPNDELKAELVKLAVGSD